MSFGEILGGILYAAGTIAAQELEKERIEQEKEKMNKALEEEFGNKNIVEILNGYLTSTQKELLIKALDMNGIQTNSTSSSNDIMREIDKGWSPEDIRLFDRKYSMYGNSRSYDGPSYIAGVMPHIPRYKIYERYNAYKKLGL